MPLDFPNAPTLNQVFGDWIWDGEKWRYAPPPFVPFDFSIVDQIDVNPGATATSAGVRITAVRRGRATPISISGGEYQTADDSGFSVNASSWTSSAGLIAEDQYVRVRHTASSSFTTGASCTLTIGPEGETESDTFNSTTRAAISVLLDTAGPGTYTPPVGSWSNSNSIVEVIGGGGGGGPHTGILNSGGGGGGGGGGYARKVGIPLPGPGGFAYQVGAGGTAGGAGGETWFDAPTTVRATGGDLGQSSGSPRTNAAGGTGTAGDVLFTGGTGGQGGGSGPGTQGGGGGGGAAGFGGNGGNGGETGTTASTSGGGGEGGGNSGAGGNASGATAGSGGGGGQGGDGGAGGFNVGNPGSNGTNWASGAGGGSGGGGGGGNTVTTGGNGGLYGGGGGGATDANSSGVGGTGGRGAIHIQH
jgi:hypothetical protein